MRASSVILGALLGVALCLPAPLLAWGLCRWKRASRRRLVAAVIGAGLASYAAWTTWMLSGIEEGGQHSSQAGFARFVYTVCLGLCQLAALVLVLVPALSLHRASRGREAEL